tara:strand:- start:611 stop:814 length:204 start_codon:yes stop_codon:yes gene_type:complete
MFDKKNAKSSDINTLVYEDTIKKKSKVDINILLNRIRVDERKKKYENLLFLSLVFIGVISVGLFFSL